MLDALGRVYLYMFGARGIARSEKLKEECIELYRHLGNDIGVYCVQ